jgi:hypothetical protein
MHRPGEPQHDIVAFGQETHGPLGLEARGILKFLAERPARWAPYGQNNSSQRYRTLVEHFSVFLQKWRAKVEVSFLRYCVDPNAPKEPLDADAQAEADGGDDEALPDVESDDGSVAGSSPGGFSPHSSQASLTGPQAGSAVHWHCHSVTGTTGELRGTCYGEVINRFPNRRRGTI